MASGTAASGTKHLSVACLVRTAAVALLLLYSGASLDIVHI